MLTIGFEFFILTALIWTLFINDLNCLSEILPE